MAFATFVTMPRGLLAIGVAVLLGGCGQVTFGPLNDVGPGDGGPEDVDVVPDAGFPDAEPLDEGPPPDLGNCTYEGEPQFPADVTAASWPFNAAQTTYETIFWNDAASFGGCNADDCHGTIEAHEPLIPNAALLDAN